MPQVVDGKYRLHDQHDANQKEALLILRLRRGKGRQRPEQKDESEDDRAECRTCPAAPKPSPPSFLDTPIGYLIHIKNKFHGILI